MSKQTTLWRQIIIGLTLCLVLIVQLLVPVNPEQTLPAVPELLSIALLSGILCLGSTGRNLQWPNRAFRLREIGVLSLLWLTVICVTGPRAILSLFSTPNQVWVPCAILPKPTELECLFQASIAQNYGFRTFFTLVAAVLMGTLAYLIARSVSYGWQLLLGAAVFGPLLVVAVGVFCVSFSIEQALPRSLLYNEWGSQRLTQIFGNPGWVWPYVAPGLAVVLWTTVIAPTWRGRLLGAGLASVLILGVLATQQRGGLVLCLLYLVACGLYYLSRGFRSRSLPILALGATILAVLADGIYSVIHNQRLLQVIARAVGYNWRANPTVVDLPRLLMWQAAEKMFEQAPLFGHGYASWFQLISTYGLKHHMPYVYGTVHNIFMQMLVELGLLHTLLVLSIFVLIALTAYQNLRLLSGGLLLFFLAVISFIIPALVQDPDYIRPSFYIHTIFWGTLTGLRFCLEAPNLIGQSDRWRQHPLFVWAERFNPLIGLSLLSGVCLMGVLFCAWNFSFGGLQFEALLTQPSTRLTRLLEPNVTLTAFKTTSNKAYSVYTADPVRKPMSVNFTEAGSQFRLTVDGHDELALALENGGRFWPRRHLLSFSAARPDGTRWMSTQVLYPPQQSNLGIGWSRNMYPWDNFGGRAGRWCAQDCIFVVKSCGRSDRLDFAVYAPRPDYSKVHPLPFQVAVYSLDWGTGFSSQVQISTPIDRVKTQLEEPGELKPFHFKGTPKTAWYLVRLQAASVFNPKVRGFSQDDRDLTVAINEVDCAATRE